MRQRTRLLQPDQFVDEELAKLPPLVRLMFCALPTIADKAGRLPDRPALIKLYTLPYDDIDPEECLQTLADCGFIVRYAVDNSNYIQIRSWDKHQKPHHREEDSQVPVPQHEIHASAKHAPSMAEPCSKHGHASAMLQRTKSPLPVDLDSDSELDSDSDGDERKGTPDARSILKDFRDWKGQEDPFNRGGLAQLYETVTTYDYLFGPKTLDWIVSHTKDVELDILKRPDRFKEFYQTDKWYAWVIAILKRAAKEKKFGQAGMKAMSAAEEEAHYQRHRNEAASRVTHPGDDTFRSIGDAIAEGEGL